MFRAIPGEGPVKVVVVGAGSMGRGWISTVLKAKSARLVGVADLVGGAAEAAVRDVLGGEPERMGIVTGRNGVEVARASDAEAIIDVTIPAAHHAVTAEALEAGLPVLGEKPCAATLAEALSLAGHAEATGELFMISQSRRHNPHLREARRLAEELGGVGIVQTMFAKAPRFGGFRDAMAHPLIVDMAIHAFDAARLLIDGDPVEVTAVAFNPGWSWYAGSAAATVTIRFDTGAVHAYTGSWCSPGDETSWNGQWRLSCEGGTITWDGENVPVTHIAGSEPTPGNPPARGTHWELAAALDEFCEALRTGREPESEVHDNIWTQAIVEAAVRSADEARTVHIRELLDDALEAARGMNESTAAGRALAAWETGVDGLCAHSSASSSPDT